MDDRLGESDLDDQDKRVPLASFAFGNEHGPRLGREPETETETALKIQPPDDPGSRIRDRGERNSTE